MDAEFVGKSHALYVFNVYLFYFIVVGGFGAELNGVGLTLNHFLLIPFYVFLHAIVDNSVVDEFSLQNFGFICCIFVILLSSIHAFCLLFYLVFGPHVFLVFLLFWFLVF